MNKFIVLMAAIFLTVTTTSKAESLTEISDFAQSICGDIPSGTITKTKIAGEVKANIGVFYKLIGGNASGTGEEEKVVYDGIPFDKLSNDIPTVSQCKIELVKILQTRKVSVIGTCRRPEFGIEKWQQVDTFSNSSGRLGGGHDQNWWCNEVTASFLNTRHVTTQSSIERLEAHEESSKDWKKHVSYKYHCTIKVSWDPLFVSKQDPLCGVTLQ